MAKLKTKANDLSVDDFLDTIANRQKRDTCFWLKDTVEKITDAPAKMWRNAIVGFGDYKYLYANGRANDWFYMGFSPRKQNIALYILGCDIENKPESLGKIGKYKIGKSCIYINKLSDIDEATFISLCKEAYQNLKNNT